MTATTVSQAPATNAAAPVATDYLYGGPTPPAADNRIEYDFGMLGSAAMLDALPTDSPSAGDQQALRLLADDHAWIAGNRAPDGKQRVPLPLCEFLAYKCGLAYEEEPIVAANLGGIGDKFRYFDTASEAGKPVADTQGFGFYYQGIAFVIFRGSQEPADWESDFLDTVTSVLTRSRDGTLVIPGLRKLKHLKLPEGDALDRLVGPLEPGRHVGFAIAWGAVRPQIEQWIADCGFSSDTPFVFSGHSLGGATAILGAHDFATGLLGGAPRRVAAVVTFGAPAVGNEAFCASYNRVLGNCTVRIEATADLVPVVMRRWYYRLDQTRRDLVRAGLSYKALHDTADRFAVVGPGWRFPQQPPLTLDDFNAAVKAQLDAMARAEKERAEASQKQGTDDAKEHETSLGQPATTGHGHVEAAGSGGKSAARDSLVTLAIWAGVAIVITLIGWLAVTIFKRNKTAAHAIIGHYAVYLSTLSYQQIRMLRAGDLDRANQDLARYLRFIRSATGKGTFFDKYENPPVPLLLKPDYQVATFIARDPTTNIV